MEHILEIAPCGMNCSLCIAYQREKNKCFGCNGPDAYKPNHCRVCRIRYCDKQVPNESGSSFCYSCNRFPCKRLKQLDARYRTKYGMSMIQNLAIIRERGIAKFSETENEKWTCKLCGALFCVHRNKCLSCGSINEAFPRNP